MSAFAWWLETIPGLVAMFVAALGLRLLIAPHIGFVGDLRYFNAWAARLSEVPLRDFYVGDLTFQYPPGYLYVLDLVGRFSASPGWVALKTPPILADLALAWTAGLLASRLAPRSLARRYPIRALVIAAVLFNPALIALSAAWGQVDSVPAAFALAAMLLLLTGPRTGARATRREIGTILCFAVAFSMKPQSVFLFPAIGYCLVDRHLLARRGLAIVEGLVRIAALAVIGLSVWVLSGVPFGKSPAWLLDFYRQAGDSYRITSVWAFNLWGVVGFWKADVPGNDPYPLVRVAGIPAGQVGTALFAAAALWLLVRTHRSIRAGHDRSRVLLFTAAACSLAGYTLLTRMHERYLFPTVVLFAPLIFSKQLRRVYWVLSALFVVNLWYPFTLYVGTWPGARDLHVEPLFGWMFGPLEATDPWQRKAWSLAMVVVCVAVLARGFTWIERSADETAPEPPRPVPPTGTDDDAGNARGFAALLASISVVGSRLGRLARTDDSGADGEASTPPPPPPHADACATDEADPPQSPSRLRPTTIIPIAAACVFNLVVLWPETTPASNLNDSAFHLQMVHWAADQMALGRIPLDGWFADLTLGSSFFHHYQSLPYNLTAAVARISGLGVHTTFLWTLYLLLALWPIAVYAGARLLGLQPGPAAAAAFLSPLVVSASNYGYEHGSYTWQGYGVYTQLFAMWLLPICWGLTWRAVSRGRGYAVAALALALTIATHLMTGYLAVLTVPIWALLARRDFGARIVRAVVVIVGGAATAAWVLVPLLSDRRWSARSEAYEGTIFNDSYGARKVLRWLLTGDIYDAGRLPVLSLLFLIGFVVCALRARRSEPARAVLAAWTLSLLLFFGRATWGSLTGILPSSGDLQMHRFLIGVHLAGIFLAGVGLVTVASAIRAAFTRLVGAATADRDPGRARIVTAALTGAAVVVLCLPVIIPQAAYDRRDSRYIAEQRLADATDGAEFRALVGIASGAGDGRIYAGHRNTWGKEYRIGQVPAYAELSNALVDSVGFSFRTVQSLSTDPEAQFSDTNRGQFEMMNVRYMILPSNREPGVPARLVAERGRHRLYAVETTGYFQVIDVDGFVEADRTSIGSATAEFRSSDRALSGRYPAVAFDGEDPAPPSSGDGPPGRLVDQTADRGTATFSAAVEMARPAYVLLKESFDPRWRVEVDGAPADAVMIAPSLVGVAVPAGPHTVTFTYRAYSYRSYSAYPLLFALGLVTLLALAVVPRRWPRRRPGPTDSMASVDSEA